MKKLTTYFEYMQEKLNKLSHEYDFEFTYGDNKDYSHVVIKGDEAVYLWYFNTFNSIRVIPNYMLTDICVFDYLDVAVELHSLRRMFHEEEELLENMAQAKMAWAGASSARCECEQWSEEEAYGEDDACVTYYPCLFEDGKGAEICTSCKDDTEQMFAAIVHQLVKEYKKLPSEFEVVQALRVQYDKGYLTSTMFHYALGLLQESTYGNTL